MTSIWHFFARLCRPFALCFIVVMFSATINAAIADDKKEQIDNLDEKIGGAKITKREAMDVALKHLQGKVTDVTVERKRGKQVYVIEIVAEKDGKENDVLVDTQTGEFLGVDD